MCAFQDCQSEQVPNGTLVLVAKRAEHDIMWISHQLPITGTLKVCDVQSSYNPSSQRTMLMHDREKVVVGGSKVPNRHAIYALGQALHISGQASLVLNRTNSLVLGFLHME